MARRHESKRVCFLVRCLNSNRRQNRHGLKGMILGHAWLAKADDEADDGPQDHLADDVHGVTLAY